MKILALLLCLMPMMAFGQMKQPKSQPIPSTETAPNAAQSPIPKDPREWSYGMRSFARAVGNIGGWWSFLSENEKSAFVDGYKQGMSLASMNQQNVCTVVMDRVKNDSKSTMEETSNAIFLCSEVSETTDYEKVSVQDIDDFYSNPLNQYMLLEWTMPYLRDKASGRKTSGQLLDAWEEEQKDVHDCAKHPRTCKAGISM